ncbi:MAG: helix-turn-helix domain-containing protein [Desulfocapsaceae bacterium]|nr:helix-turn-helix domain-containing protein [Desulfocapsaceae bacterium]
MENRKAASPPQAGTLGETASKQDANYTTSAHCLPCLSARHRRILKALTENPAGLRSFDLRKHCGCMNVADEVMAMRRRGFDIPCTMEPYKTVDGTESRIGRYRLVGQGMPKK